MSSSQPLVRTEHGTACYCACCSRLEIALGNAILYVTPSDLPGLIRIIDRFKPEDIDGARDDRKFVLRTEQEDAAFAFNEDELSELRTLIDGARLCLRYGKAPTTTPAGATCLQNTLH